jgi:hypothetical protein
VGLPRLIYFLALITSSKETSYAIPVGASGGCAIAVSNKFATFLHCKKVAQFRVQPETIPARPLSIKYLTLSPRRDAVSLVPFLALATSLFISNNKCLFWVKPFNFLKTSFFAPYTRTTGTGVHPSVV